MSIIHLKDKDFNIQEGAKGKLLCCNLKGVSIVLFFSNRCPHCENLAPIFHQLSRNIPSCQFAMLNITTNYGVAEASKDTIAPITHVPFIVLYIQGRPFLKYNGPKTEVSIENFIVNVISHVANKKAFHNLKVSNELDFVPEYQNGPIPFNIVCDAETCYVTYGELGYDKQNQQQHRSFPPEDPKGGIGIQRYGNYPTNLQDPRSSSGTSRMQMRGRATQDDYARWSGM